LLGQLAQVRQITIQRAARPCEVAEASACARLILLLDVVAKLATEVQVGDVVQAQHWREVPQQHRIVHDTRVEQHSIRTRFAQVQSGATPPIATHSGTLAGR